MFQAVRQWWGNGRGKLTARLFVFEFVVVVAGVLAAQALANWVGTRAEREAGRRLFADATERAPAGSNARLLAAFRALPSPPCRLDQSRRRQWRVDDRRCDRPSGHA